MVQSLHRGFELRHMKRQIFVVHTVHDSTLLDINDILGGEDFTCLILHNLCINLNLPTAIDSYYRTHNCKQLLLRKQVLYRICA